MISNRHRWERAAWMLLGLGLASLGVWGWGSAAVPQPVSEHVRVAVVDLQRLFAGLNESAEKQQRLNELAERLQQQVDELAQRLDAARRERDLLPRNSPEYWDLASRILELEVQAKARKEAGQQLLSLHAGDVMVESFEKMLDAITRYARQEGFDVVLADDRPVLPPRGKGANVVRDAIDSRQVLYAGPRVDITDALITMMNNEYRAGMAPSRPAPAGPGGSAAGPRP